VRGRLMKGTPTANFPRLYPRFIRHCWRTSIEASQKRMPFLKFSGLDSRKWLTHTA